jgi:hypothetical protein
MVRRRPPPNVKCATGWLGHADAAAVRAKLVGSFRQLRNIDVLVSCGAAGRDGLADIASAAGLEAEVI